MKKFVSIQDVELNDMKKKELEEANGGGFIELPDIFPMPYGLMPPEMQGPAIFKRLPYQY